MCCDEMIAGGSASLPPPPGGKAALSARRRGQGDYLADAALEANNIRLSFLIRHDHLNFLFWMVFGPFRPESNSLYLIFSVTAEIERLCWA